MLDSVKRLIFVLPLFIGVMLLSGHSIAATNSSTWQPQISEKILMLPSKHLENAVERDFASSPLANDMQTLDEDIQSKVTTIGTLQENQHLYEGAESLEVTHQIIAGKRDYLDMMSGQIDLRRQQLETKRNLYQRLMRQAKSSSIRSPQVEQHHLAIDAARVRSGAVETQLRDELFFSTNLEESKFGLEYAENRTAIEQLRSAINNHPANRDIVINGEPVTKAEELNGLMLGVEAELALLSMEEEVIGYMAKLLSLDAMAFAEKVAEASWQSDDGSIIQPPTSPRQNLKMFIAF
jgi:hypothetical protein